MATVIESTQDLLKKAQSKLPTVNEGRYVKRNVFIYYRTETPPEGQQVIVYLLSGGLDIATFHENRWINMRGKTVQVRWWFEAPTQQGGSFAQVNTPIPDKVSEGMEIELISSFEDILDTDDLSEKGPKIEHKNVSLHKHERPVDYGHCHMIMKDKYGEEKGEEYYHKLIDHPKSGAIHFVVATQIQREKKKMLQDTDQYNRENMEKKPYPKIREEWDKHHSALHKDK